MFFCGTGASSQLFFLCRRWWWWWLSTISFSGTGTSSQLFFFMPMYRDRALVFVFVPGRGVVVAFFDGGNG